MILDNANTWKADSRSPCQNILHPHNISPVLLAFHSHPGLLIWLFHRGFLVRMSIKTETRSENSYSLHSCGDCLPHFWHISTQCLRRFPRTSQPITQDVSVLIPWLFGWINYYIPEYPPKTFIINYEGNGKQVMERKICAKRNKSGVLTPAFN
jgi:hypothetical protein